MSIDLREVEPLGSKSVLLEQAMRRNRAKNPKTSNFEEDMMDMITPDFEWLKEDKTALENLVRQMDASIGQLASQMRELEQKNSKARQAIEKEQHLLFKQIRTLNGLLKKQVDTFSVVEQQIDHIDLKNNNLLPQIGIGLIAGLMSAVTILATAPWLSVFLQSMS